MKTFATLAATALVMVGTLGAPQAQARGGGAVAAGVIGGLAAGALLGAAISDAHAAPAYGYGYGYSRPAYGYAPVAEEEYVAPPVYRTRRVVRTYDDGPAYGYRPAGYGYGYGHRHCDRPYEYGGW